MMADLPSAFSSNVASASEQSSATDSSPVPAATAAGIMPASDTVVTAQAAQQADAAAGTQASVQADSQAPATQSAADQVSGKASPQSEVCAPVDGELLCIDPQGPLAHKAKGPAKSEPAKVQGGKHRELHKPGKAVPTKGAVPGAVLPASAENVSMTPAGSAALAAKTVAGNSAGPASDTVSGAGADPSEMVARPAAALSGKVQSHVAPSKDTNAGDMAGALAGSLLAGNVAARSDATQPMPESSGDDAAHAAVVNGGPIPATLLEVVKPTEVAPPVSFAPSLISGMSRTSSNASTGAPRAVAAASQIEPAAGAANGTVAGGKGLEVGFQDSTLGWLSVRANTAGRGELHLAISAATERSGASLHDMLPDLKTYLNQHGIVTDSLTAFSREHGMLNTSADALQAHGLAPGLLAAAITNDLQNGNTPSGLGHNVAAFQPGAEQGRRHTDGSAENDQRTPQQTPQQNRAPTQTVAASGMSRPRTDVAESGPSISVPGNHRMLSVRI